MRANNLEGKEQLISQCSDMLEAIGYLRIRLTLRMPHHQ
jgi:hypothetical protein